MADTASSQILDEIPKKIEVPNVQTVSNWRKFKKAFQAVFYFKDLSLTFCSELTSFFSRFLCSFVSVSNQLVKKIFSKFLKFKGIEKWRTILIFTNWFIYCTVISNTSMWYFISQYQYIMPKSDPSHKVFVPCI